MEKAIVKKIEDIIDVADYCRNAFFWSPQGSANGRRYEEKKWSREKVEWDENGHHYTAEYTLSESCHNVYARGNYTRDGKTTTLTAIKNSYKRLSNQVNKGDENA